MRKDYDRKVLELRHLVNAGLHRSQRMVVCWRLLAIYWAGFSGVEMVEAMTGSWLSCFFSVMALGWTWYARRQWRERRREIRHFSKVMQLSHQLTTAQSDTKVIFLLEQMEAAVEEAERK